jgi:hypothetical protein
MQRKFVARLGIGVSPHAFDVHKLAGRRRPKALDATPLDIQLIAGLPDIALQAVSPC